eukprot:maker-scaffold325_size206031-snap-gene-1.15 protein:Tk11604 transcript:maker-scaffold325_size206031-snap-gene-1.15-mRNA-1 annotation:"15-hydroxyprostaglandin dehydrogenase"
MRQCPNRKSSRFSWKKGIKTLSHPPYSPDLAPADFFLFPKCKKELAGVTMKWEDVTTNLDGVCGTIPIVDFVEAFHAWKRLRTMAFEGQTAIVTGGARGIGQAIARELLQGGVKCLIGDISYQLGEETCSMFQSEFGPDRVIFIRLDINSHSNFEEAFSLCIHKFGRVDILVNNAGIISEIGWESQGTIRGCKLALKFMSRNGSPGLSTQKGGLVLNVSSNQGLVSWPAMPVYSAGKSGINAYTRCAGHPLEYAVTGVKMVSLCPFGVDTPFQLGVKHSGMTQVGQDFLSANDSAYTTQVLSAADVGQAALEVMRIGSSGSVWYLHAHGETAFEVPDPYTYEHLMELQQRQKNSEGDQQG